MVRTQMKFPCEKDYPKVIYLRGTAWQIKFVKNLGAIGLTDSEKETVFIRSGMSRNEIFRTILHELLHVIEFTWPVKIPHKLVYKLEKAIFQLILDNFS